MANTAAAIAPAMTATTTAAAVAEQKIVRTRGTPSQILHNKGRVLPTSTGEKPVPFDCWLLKAAFCNTHTSAVTVTLSDNQTTAVKLLDAKSIATKDTLNLDYGPEGIFMKGGITWFAGTADVLNGFLTIKK